MNWQAAFSVSPPSAQSMFAQITDHMEMSKRIEKYFKRVKS